jgi:hypothetical protein
MEFIIILIMVYIYILSLKSNKYYIGKTNNPNFRLNQHFNSEGSIWTKKYKPIKIIKIIPNCDNFDEDKYTKKYMHKYGMNNVRGGSFCSIQLSEKNKSTIQKELDSANDKCYNCGKHGHYAEQCRKIDNNKLEKTYKKSIKENRCFRCNRTGHYAEYCYAITYDNGEIISKSYESDDESEYEIWSCNYCGKEFDSEKGALYHERKYCKKKINICFRCGRKGHSSSTCYAKTYVKECFI